MSQKKTPKKQTSEASKPSELSKPPPKRTPTAEILFHIEIAPTSEKDKTPPPQVPTSSKRIPDLKEHHESKETPKETNERSS
jgi:hypothetical protein